MLLDFTMWDSKKLEGNLLWNSPCSFMLTQFLSSFDVTWPFFILGETRFLMAEVGLEFDVGIETEEEGI